MSVPPPPPIDNISAHPRSLRIEAKANQRYFDECFWAENNAELQKACYLSRVCTRYRPKFLQYRSISNILQNGPTCGLTAISMLFNGDPPPEQLLNRAKQQKYTINGEIFSAKNLCDLICDISKEKIGNTIEARLFEGSLNCAEIKECLRDGACIFVPYDPDFNHGPCLKSGHKAHWALIIGYLIDSSEEFFVLARHGKARNLAVWSLEALSASNSNLIEFAQPKGYPDAEFLLPDGGIGGDLGLKERAVIVNGIQNEIIVL